MPKYFGSLPYSDDDLQHYGVTGMKWGVHKVVPYSQSYRNAKAKLDDLLAQRKARVASRTSVTGRPLPAKQPGKTAKFVSYSSNSSNKSSKNPSGKILARGVGKTSQSSWGKTGKGNIDLWNRPVVKNKDGTISTVRSISIGVDNKTVLIPTVVNGRVVDDKKAIDHYYKTGEHLGEFDSEEEADEYANRLHEAQEFYYDKKEKAKKAKSSVVSMTKKGGK